MLETRSVRDLRSLCPAAYTLGETPAGSAVLCRVTGRVVATGTDPSSLAAYCCAPVAAAHGPASDGSGQVGIGYQACSVWRHNRERELREKAEWDPATPQRVRQALEPEFQTRA